MSAEPIRFEPNEVVREFVREHKGHQVVVTEGEAKSERLFVCQQCDDKLLVWIEDEAGAREWEAFFRGGGALTREEWARQGAKWTPEEREKAKAEMLASMSQFMERHEGHDVTWPEHTDPHQPWTARCRTCGEFATLTVTFGHDEH